MIFTTGPVAPRGAYNDSSNRRFACSTVGIPAWRFKTISFVCEGGAPACFLRAALLVWGGHSCPPAERSSAAVGGQSSSRSTLETMTNHSANPLPNGVRAIAALFALCGIYLAIAGGLMLVRPGTISMSAGAPLLFGPELAGAYMFLLLAVR